MRFAEEVVSQMKGFVGSGSKEDESENRAKVSQVLYDRIGYAGP